MTSLVGDYAKQVKTVGMKRVSRKDLAIQNFSLWQLPCLVMMDCLVEQFGNDQGQAFPGEM